MIARFVKWYRGRRDARLRARGVVQCDVCDRWGRSNPNYKGCDGRAFVHVSEGGATYVHATHVMRHLAATRRPEG